MIISEKLARTAYRAYGESTGWKNFRGDPMPEYDALPAPIQAAWRAASLAVAQETPSVLGIASTEVSGTAEKGSFGPEADCG